MSQTIELSEPLYAALKRAAEATGTTPAGWIAAHLTREASAEAPPDAGSLADLFEGRVGRIRSGGAATLSERCAETFTDDLQQKRREGRL